VTRVVARGLGEAAFQHVSQLGTGSDAELRKYSVEVRADGSMREVEHLPYLAVGASASRELSDLELLRSELVSSLRDPSAACLT
jgi:hypothetical protein